MLNLRLLSLLFFRCFSVFNGHISGCPREYSLPIQLSYRSLSTWLTGGDRIMSSNRTYSSIVTNAKFLDVCTNTSLTSPYFSNSLLTCNCCRQICTMHDHTSVVPVGKHPTKSLKFGRVPWAQRTSHLENLASLLIVSRSAIALSDEARCMYITNAQPEQ